MADRRQPLFRRVVLTWRIIRLAGGRIDIMRCQPAEITSVLHHTATNPWQWRHGCSALGIGAATRRQRLWCGLSGMVVNCCPIQLRFINNYYSEPILRHSSVKSRIHIMFRSSLLCALAGFGCSVVQADVVQIPSTSGFSGFIMGGVNQLDYATNFFNHITHRFN